jgi:hypothetical protein
MRNPLRSEQEMFRFLLVVIVGAAVIVGCAYANTWLGVAAAVLVVGGIGVWLSKPPTDGPGAPPAVAPTPPGTHRVLLVATADADVTQVRDAIRARLDGSDAEVLVVVPALASTVEALTGAVDDRREAAERAADALAAQLTAIGIPARGTAGADDPIQAAEDALGEFGADEVVLAGNADLFEQAQDRLSVPVTRLG